MTAPRNSTPSPRFAERERLAAEGVTIPAALMKEPPMPLEIGVVNKVSADLRPLLVMVVSSAAYNRALAAKNSMRHALDSTVVGPVADDHRAIARALKRRRNVKAQRRHENEKAIAAKAARKAAEAEGNNADGKVAA